MTEAAGLAIGGIGLAGLFTTCIDCLDRITLARNHGKDFQVSLTQVPLLNVRLSTWGEIVRAQNEGNELAALRDQWPHIGTAVQNALVTIKDAFDDVTALERRYGLKASLTTGDTAIIVREPRAVNDIMDAFHIVQRRQQKETSLARKFWWAVHDKKGFDALLQVLNVNIESLEKIGEGLNVLEKQKEKLQSVIEDIDDEDSIGLLEEAKKADDNTKRSSSSGHSFLKNIISDKARVTVGNIGHSSGSNHQAEHNRITGSTVHVGDMTGEAAASLWNGRNVFESADD